MSEVPPTPPAAPGSRHEIKLRPDVALLPLDDGMVAFIEHAQCLAGLNATAALVVRALQAGTPADGLVRALVDREISRVDAEAWIPSTLEALSSHGLLADGKEPTALPMGDLEEDRSTQRTIVAPPLEGFAPVAERRYRLLETTMLVRFGIPAQRHLVDSIIGHLRVDDDRAPDFEVDITAVELHKDQYRSNIYRDGVWVDTAHKLSWLGPIVKHMLWKSAIVAHDFLFYIHAGVLGRDGRCVLLPATAGSGKSSLSAALAHAGFRFFSDEVALLHASTFRVPAMPLAICVKDTGWELMTAYYPELPKLPVHHRKDQKTLRYIPPPPGAIKQAPWPVGHIIFPRYTKGAATELEPLSRVEGLGRLMGECLAMRQKLTQENVTQLVRWMAGIECYALRFSSLTEAVERVSEATGVRGSGPLPAGNECQDLLRVSTSTSSI